MDRVKVRRILTEYFSEDELKTLCFDLGIDYENLPGEGKEAKSRELIAYCERCGRLLELMEVGEQLRSNVSWKDELERESLESQLRHNLPPRGEFVGRHAEIARIQEAFRSGAHVVCIDGIGGIGKTALALQVAYECLKASQGKVMDMEVVTFEGLVWITARDREIFLELVLDTIARTLEYPGITQQPLEEKQDSVRRLLRKQRVLLIVDNFETVDDERIRDFLFSLPEPSRALITTRERNIGEAWAVSVKSLPEPEALTLIRYEAARLDLRSVQAADDRLLLRLYEAAGGAPLAIKWAMGQIKQRGQSLDMVLAALHNARGDVFKTFSRSWQLLSNDARSILLSMPFLLTPLGGKPLRPLPIFTILRLMKLWVNLSRCR